MRTAKLQTDIFTTLADAQAFVKGNSLQGCTCPACGVYRKIWRKKPISTAVASLCKLIRLYLNEAKYYHLDRFNIIAKDRNISQLQLWNLIEDMQNEDKSKRASGYYRPTQKGIDFVFNRITIPKYVLTDNSKIIGFEGVQINVYQALGNKFNYEVLMNENY